MKTEKESSAIMNRVPEISVAPMMDWTDRHCRYFLRLISPHALLYSEMITAQAIIHGNTPRLLGFDQAEHPVALQLGGSEPDHLARAAATGERFGYVEINLNCGCPSDRVREGRFGACLMLEPDRVAACVVAMTQAVSLPVTVKCRIGVDYHDSYEDLYRFVETVAEAGCRKFIIHARKAWLSGLSPRENRDIPPLSYDTVVRIRKDFPDLKIILNGGIKTMEQIRALEHSLDGFMIGREAYQNPWLLHLIERDIFNLESVRDRADIARRMIPYIQEQNDRYGTPVKSVIRHMLGLFQGIPGGRNWRRVLSTKAHIEGAGPEIINLALAEMEEASSRARA